MNTEAPTMTMDHSKAPGDRSLAEEIDSHAGRLRRFLSSRLVDRRDVEDVLQDVFYELVLAYRMIEPIENVGAWLFRVARNRTTDLFRKKRPETAGSTSPLVGDEPRPLEDLLPSLDAGPEAVYVRKILIEELADALDDLPPEQRWVFLAHEAEGRSFRELSAETGISINTLLSRKRYAVLHLRRRLAAIYADYRKG